MNAVAKKPMTFAEIRARKNLAKLEEQEEHPANVALELLQEVVAEVDGQQAQEPMVDVIELEPPNEADAPAPVTKPSALQRYFAKAPSEAKLIELRDKYAGFAPITDKAGLKDAMSAQSALRKARLAIESAREPIKELAKQALAEEKRLKAIIEPTEALVTKYREEYEEAERLKAEAEERAKAVEAMRVEGIKAYIHSLRMAPVVNVGKSSDALKLVVESLAQPIGEDYAQEFTEEANAARVEALKLVYSMMSVAKVLEETEAKAKADREAMLAEMEAMRRELQAAREALNPPKPGQDESASHLEKEVAGATIQEQESDEPSTPSLESIAAKYKLEEWQFPAVVEAWELGIAGRKA